MLQIQQKNKAYGLIINQSQVVMTSPKKLRSNEIGHMGEGRIEQS